MEILKKLANLEPRDLVLSLPKDKAWEDYTDYFLELKLQDLTLDIILPSIPKTDSGKKCYLVCDGYVRGWMEIIKIKETPANDICIELMPYLFKSLHKLPMGDIEGFKYYYENLDLQ